MTTPNRTPIAIPHLSRLNPAQRDLLLLLAAYQRAGEIPACSANPRGLQRSTKTRPALVYTGGKDRQGIKLDMTVTPEGAEIVNLLAGMSREEAIASMYPTHAASREFWMRRSESAAAL